MNYVTDKLVKHRLPAEEMHLERVKYYVEETPVPEYRHASEEAMEGFRDIKYGIRIHWGVYALQQVDASWPLVLKYNDAERDEYQQLYQRFNPKNFSADKWMDFFKANGLRMFAFTTKHADGFSMYDTKARVKQRVNWGAAGGPVIEDCDVAYSIMETPLKRDIVKELCDAAHQRDIKVDLYYSHPDWYDADFRNYFFHPIQTPEYIADRKAYGDGRGVDHIEPPALVAPDPTPAQVDRMMARYRAQLMEILTNYGKVDMVCLDCWLGPKVWPQLRQILIDARKVQPDVMFRARGIGNYGDYYTPEDFIPGDKEATTIPWFAIERLSDFFSYDPDAAHYKNGEHIIRALVDCVSKGGNFMVAIGPDEEGNFHPAAVAALEEAGAWLKINGEAIYATRARVGELWKEGNDICFTRTKDSRIIYAFCMQWPGAQLRLTSVSPREGSTIRLLGFNEALIWRREGNGTVIELPQRLQDASARPCQHVWAIKIEAGESAARD